ncbi:hypothetical protein G2469_00061 [Escherichia phage vB_EcoM_G2469]|uniref:Homing endonuclease n=1 Tax=Escherichia phage vB_EcoM_G2469 TaxID=2502415 RepID=A0A482GK24_9CAUD|nr:hypothetical protein G2469_00061 [Escherichia phage vB_EcoM_G2469]QZI79964.1 hypothetical protein 172859UKE1_037 [Escherichia phage vB_EcoM-172859UKE1]
MTKTDYETQIYKILKTSFPSWEGLDEYLNFIKTNSTNKVKGLTQVHHILPKSIFPDFKTCKWNLCHLSHYNHFIAHSILAKTGNHKMINALQRMYTGRFNLNCTTHELNNIAEAYSLEFENVCKVNSIKMTLYYSNQDNRIKISQALKAWFKNPENLKKHRIMTSSKEFKETVSIMTQKWFSDPINKQKHLDACRKISKTAEYRESLSAGVSRSWKNPKVRDTHLKSRRKGYHWENFDMLYVEWVKMNKPKYVTFSKNLVNLGYPIQSSLQALVSEFMRKNLSENI